MENILLGAGLMLVAVMLGMWWLRRRVEQQVAELLQALREAERQHVVLLSVEEIDGMIYGWDMTNQEFVCQGRTARELSASFEARYPTRSAAVASGPEPLLQRLRQESRAAQGDAR